MHCVEHWVSTDQCAMLFGPYERGSVRDCWNMTNMHSANLDLVCVCFVFLRHIRSNALWVGVCWETRVAWQDGVCCVLKIGRNRYGHGNSIRLVS